MQGLFVLNTRTIGRKIGAALLAASLALPGSVIYAEEGDDWIPDPPAAISFDAPVVTVDEGAGYAYVGVSRTGAASSLTVDYATYGGTATEGTDYLAASGQITFGPGETFATIEIPITNDIQFEPAESFSVELFNVSDGVTSIDRGTTTVTIADNDPDVPYNPGKLGFATALTEVDENHPDGTVSLTVARSEGTDGYVAVDYQIDGGTAGNGADFEGTGGTLSFEPGESSKTIQVTLYDDAESEGNEYFHLSLSNPTNDATLAESSFTKVRILDNEPWTPRAGSFEVNPTAPMGEASGTHYINVIRTDGADVEAAIDYTIAGVTAEEGSDFTGSSGTLVFPVDETLQYIPLPILDDALSEGNETLTITLSNPTSGAVIGTYGTRTYTIEDNEPHEEQHPGMFMLGASQYAVDENGGSAKLQVTRMDGADGEATLTYSILGGSAAENADYAGNSGQLTFADGETEKFIEVPIVDDSMHEAEEQFQVRLLDATGGAVVGPNYLSGVTIKDNDPAGVLQFSPFTTTVYEESKQVTMTVARTGDTSGTASVAYATKDYSALAGRDYAAQSGVLTFAPGETQKKITITMYDDSVKEWFEYFSILLSNPAGAELGTYSTGLVYVYDNDKYTYPTWPRY
ncbi:Calx-beta domain-containing protein [Paenibacillus methanolicus]|uniref:Calx-beta domain-containing protein n=1 Tax=Paenibacillus methanolicus TaxID=582686 RepID=A0A5S5C6F8_9BACL|nr:Calx-beta domain-containing protein [Paenibacillus methanolicus]TYP74749.1 Calx-beta domain-containing protein [Paenibacillus methanolicus]